MHINCRERVFELELPKKGLIKRIFSFKETRKSFQEWLKRGVSGRSFFQRTDFTGVRWSDLAETESKSRKESPPNIREAPLKKLISH